jgi:hypothetical protein
MKRLFMSSLTLSVLFLIYITPHETAFAQARADVSSGAAHADTPVDVGRIISAVAAKETEFHKALNAYLFKRDAVIQTIGAGGQITGEFHLVSQFSFDDSGKRYEKVIFSPAPTLTEISISKEDLEDLGGVQPFALQLSRVDQYKFTYMGKERIDELDLYVFDVEPKVAPTLASKERFFKGRIWVDDRDLQIIKVRGKGVPEGEQRFPTFETYREQVDGRYWFPTYTYSDEELEFADGSVRHVRMRVRYTDYRRFHSDVKIIEDDEPQTSPAPAPSPSKTKP